jgi:hypothetical protein
MASAQDLLRVARSQLGYREGANNNTKYGRWYGMNHAAWCDMFVAWCANECGALKIVGKFAYTPYHAGWFHDHGRWGSKPRVGAIVFFDWAGSHKISAIDHVGIVEAVRKGSIVTIEGNTDNRVMRRVRRIGIAGYGYPKYGKTTGQGGGGGSGGQGHPKPGTKAPKWPGRYLQLTTPLTHGSDVRTWQSRMRQRGWDLAADGVYGPQSAQTCRRFQGEKHLGVDGVVGPKTWRAAWESPIT